ncbi:MAG: right-handed parallel beta-helix repeat-containing protein [Phycisphaerales bacterium]|nr:MAG: right-handed parallel beta-helix repeat-containing protein [Phycisphaerales bacterium]
MKRRVLFTITLLFAPNFAPAATRLVPSQYPNIQAAIDACTDGETVIVAPGTYSGPGNRDIDFKGKAVTVRSENGPENCIIDCQGSDNHPRRGFYFRAQEGPDSVLDGFTIANGWVGYGGGIFCENSSPTIRNCRLIENESVGPHGGGGIRLASSNAIIDGCIIKGNYGQYGGGITCKTQSSPTILNCLIVENRAGKSNSYGGGIFCTEESSPIITNCTLSGNTAGYASGGMYIGGDSTAHITNCVFWGNSTEIDVHTFYGTAVVSHCLIKGGFTGEANLDADPCFADPCSGDYSLSLDSPCVDAGTNEPPGGLPQTDLAGASRTIDGDNDGTAVADIGAYEAALPAQPVIEISKEHFLFTATEGGPDPNTQTLTIRNGGGATLNWRIASDSSWLSVSPGAGQSTGEAHDVTLSAATGALAGGRYDGRLTVSDPRSLNSPRLVAVTLYVSAEVAQVPGRYPTIQEAIDYVLDGGTVVLAPCAYTGEGNRDLDFKGKAITVRSTDPRDANIVAATIIDCQGTKEVPHRGFSFVSGEGRDSILDGLTVTKGCAPNVQISSYSYSSYGGAIYCQGSSPTISRCRIMNNRSVYYRGGGAGICCYDNSNPLIDHCIIAGNVDTSYYTYYGGGAAVFCEKQSHPVVTHCTIVANNADLSTGGGIKIGWQSGATIANCIFWRNSAALGPQIDIARTGYDDISVSHCDIQGGLAGISTPDLWPLDWCRYIIDADPCLVDPNAGDYHLSNLSPCINAGDPNFGPGPDLTDIDGDPRVINGRIDIGADEFDAEGPVIEISPRLFHFYAEEFGPDPQPQTLTIRNSGAGSLKWRMTEDCPWLSLTPTFGESAGRPNQIELAASVEALNIGRYKCKLHGADPNAVNTPQSVTVFLHVYGTAAHVPAQLPTIQDGVDYVFDGGKVIVADGLYTGPGNRNVDFKGKNLTLHSENGPEHCIIDCQKAGRAFYFHSAEDANAVLDGLTITNGSSDPDDYYTPTDPPRGNGGAILCENSGPTITNCVITRSYAGYYNGGAIACTDSNSIITNCRISDNTARGAVLASGEIAGGAGGAIFAHAGSPIIDNCTITNNSGAHGGGISCGPGTTVSRCRITGNSAVDDGGGITCSGGLISDCVVAGNQGHAWHGGGGIYCSGSPTIINCTIAANQHGSRGGGIYTRGANVGLINSIVWANSAPDGNELYLYTVKPYHAPNVPSQLAVSFSNVRGAAESAHIDPCSTLNWLVGNIDADPLFAQTGYWDANGTPGYTRDDFWIDGSYHLLPGSPCIDAGTNEPNLGLAATDLAGNPRVVDGDLDGIPVVDMGACEHDPNIPAIELSARQFAFDAIKGGPDPEPQILNIHNSGAGTLNWQIACDCNWLSAWPDTGSSTGDVNSVALLVDTAGLQIGDHLCLLRVFGPNAVNSPAVVRVTLHMAGVLHVPSEYPTIQAAVDAASDDDIILVADGLYSGDGNRDIQLQSKSITIRSENGPQTCIIDCNGSADDPHRGFYFSNASGLLLSGFTIINGYAGDYGGAMRFSAGAPNIADCAMIGSYAKRGGAVYCTNSNPTFTRCRFLANRAEVFGAGIYNNNGDSTFVDCTFSKNLCASSGAAVGIYGRAPKFTGCAFYANVAQSGGGGAVSSTSASPTFRNCIFARNSGLYGGAIENNGSRIVAANCTFTANTSSVATALCTNYGPYPSVTNCIIWDGPNPIWDTGLPQTIVTYSNVSGGWAGLGNIEADPCFVASDYWDPNGTPGDPGDDFWVEGDYHLKSAGWRWDTQRRVWTWDNVTSRCIDAGNPGSRLADEPLSVPADPNNEWGRNIRINMGAYGGTPEASIPPHNWSLPADLTNDGAADLADLDQWSQSWLGATVETPADLDRNATVDLVDFALLADNWLARTTWREP